MSAFYKLLLGLLILLVFFSGRVNAEDWQLYTDIDGLRIEYKYAECDLERGYDQEWVLLKITNSSGTRKLVKWKSDLWYNEECKTCEVKGEEYVKSVSVDQGETLEGTCSIYSNGSLNIFVKFIDEQYRNTNRQVLTKFELNNLSVTAIK